jgi:hypothetical protein
VPAGAAVSASSALVPRLSRRAQVYVFPAVLDAEYVYLDLQASPGPTSAGDVYLRIQALAAGGGWQVQNSDDGLLLLRRVPDAPPATIAVSLVDNARTAASANNAGSPEGNFTDPPRAYDAGRISLVSAVLVPSSDGAVDVDGPRWILRTTWRAEQPLTNDTRLDFWLSLRDGQQMHVWDIAPLWWNPPGQWTPGQPVTVDVPDVPIRQFVSWQATFSDASERGLRAARPLTERVTSTDLPPASQRLPAQGQRQPALGEAQPAAGEAQPAAAEGQPTASEGLP